MAPSQRTRPAHRRRRSVRFSVVVALLVAAAAATAASLAAGSPLVWALTCCGVLAAFGASVRILGTELRQSREEQARQRVAHAREVARLMTERSGVEKALAHRLAGQEREVRELESTLRLSERRAYDAELRTRRAVASATDARRRVQELEVALEVRRPVDVDVSEETEADVDTVVDLMSWEDRQSGAARAAWQRRRHA